MSNSVVLERLPPDSSGQARLLQGQLKRQRVYIFPTLQGCLYLIMLIVMLLGAINYNNSMAFMLCFLLASLGLICMLHTYRNLAGLILNATKPEAVFLGQQALFPIQLDNRLNLSKVSILLTAQDTRKKVFWKKKQYPAIPAGIKTGNLSTYYYPLPTQQRGELKLKRLKISSTFPLGIFTAWSYYEPDRYCLVYPAPKGDKQFPASSIHEDNLDFGIETGADDFAGFRKYKPGDAVNLIAWKAYAREQGLLVKQFSGKGSQVLMLSWASVAHINNIESRLSQLCYWIILADKSSLGFGLDIPGTKIEPDQGTHHTERCLEALARYGTV